MSVKIIKEQNMSWIHIDAVDEEARQYLKEHHSFHPLDLEDLENKQQTPKIDAYKNYVFAVLQFPIWNGSTKIVAPFELNFFVGENYLITIQREKSKEMKGLFYRCLNNKNTRVEWMGGNSGYLLYHIIEELFHSGRPILNHLGEDISKIENEIFDGSQNSFIIRELAMYRRNVLNFSRILEPQRYIINTLSGSQQSFLTEHEHENMKIYFDNIQDYINNMWAIIESYKETINGLHTTVESLINRRTNKIIRSLTIISVSLMPLTLLSGIYGMNIDRLPFAHNPIYVWMLFLGLVCAILITIYLMAKKRDL